ncbi:MAG: hypothetical protein HZC29_01075 [Thaumarchaeota archaeon]|nr:hypothetical protein [Nitrososphaerota archaeon]
MPQKSPSKWKGLNEIKLKFDSVTERNEEFKLEVISRMESYFYEILRELIPYFEGRYFGSFQTIEKTSNKLVIGTSKGQLYVQLEFTGIQAPFIMAKNKKALHWIDPFTGEGVFVKYYAVDSPLQRYPRPHVRPTVDAIKRAWVDIMYEVAKEKFPFLMGHLNTESFQNRKT